MTNKQFPKGGDISFGYNVVLPDGYDAKKQYPLIVFIHGIGECSGGTLANLTNVYNWVKNNSFLLDAVDRYGFIVVIPTYLNTTAEKSKVCKWILERIKATYPVQEDLVAFVGHSNGSHTLGTWAFADAEFAKQVSVWAASASGPFTTAATFKNVAEYDVRIWGITAENDKYTGTDPKYVTQLAEKVPALNPKATVVITEFPATRWPGVDGGKFAHNAVLGQLTKTPLPFLSMGSITSRIPSKPRMDLYQWILSNPKESIPQLPDEPYSGPKWPEVVSKPEPVVTQPEPVKPERSIIGYNVIGENIKISVLMSDGKWETIELAGDENREIWIPSRALDRPTVRFEKAGKKMQIVK